MAINKEISAYMRKIGARGLKSRWSKMTAKERSEYARKISNMRKKRGGDN